MTLWYIVYKEQANSISPGHQQLGEIFQDNQYLLTLLLFTANLYSTQYPDERERENTGTYSQHNLASPSLSMSHYVLGGAWGLGQGYSQLRIGTIYTKFSIQFQGHLSRGMCTITITCCVVGYSGEHQLSTWSPPNKQTTKHNHQMNHKPRNTQRPWKLVSSSLQGLPPFL